MDKIAIIGAGNMGSAIALGLAGNNYDVMVSNRSRGRLEALAAAHPGVGTTLENAVAAHDARLVIIAVRPADTLAVVRGLRDDFAPGAVVATLAPTVSLDMLGAELPEGVYAARLMPNTAIRMSSSMTFVAFGADVPAPARAVLVAAMELLGTVAEIREELFGAATALCSCGVAYALRYVRAACEGAVQLGFGPAEAARYVAATMQGAARLLLEGTDAHPEAEIDRVTTPGGTTIRGLNAMEEAGFTAAVIRGLLASAHE